MPKSLCQKFGFNQATRESRLQLLGLDHEANLILSCLHEKIIVAADKSIVDAFYDYLLAQEPFKEFLISDTLVDQLRQKQQHYIKTIGVDFDSEAYFESRLRIGLAHANIGLKLSLYICSFSVLQEIISNRILQCHVLNKNEKIQLQKYLIRITTLDKTLAVESYVNTNIEYLEHSIDDLREKSASLRTEVDYDSLTCVHSRKKIMSYLRIELLKHQRNNTPLAVAVADLDNFKRVNDRYGHLAGDAVLKHVASRIQGSIRDIDLVGRYGGEEFLILLPGINVGTAKIITERIRTIVAETPITFEHQKITITISLGLTIATSQDDMKSLFSRADQLMYDAKHHGRNCIHTDENS